MYKHLFVPVDGSELSHRAMDGSIALAKQLGARITGFVVEPDLPFTAAASRTEGLLVRMKDNESKNEAHAAALLGQFEARAKVAGVEFCAHHVTAYLVDQAIMEEAEKSRLRHDRYGDPWSQRHRGVCVWFTHKEDHCD